MPTRTVSPLPLPLSYGKLDSREGEDEEGVRSTHTHTPTEEPTSILASRKAEHTHRESLSSVSLLGGHGIKGGRR